MNCIVITVTRARSFGRHQLSSENAPWLDPIQIIDFLKHLGGLEKITIDLQVAGHKYNRIKKTIEKMYLYFLSYNIHTGNNLANLRVSGNHPPEIQVLAILTIRGQCISSTTSINSSRTYTVEVGAMLGLIGLQTMLHCCWPRVYWINCVNLIL